MTSFRDRLKNAQFRGAGFFVDSHQYQGGRRVQVNEFPQRNTPFPDDQGRKAKSYTLNAYVLEPLPWSADAKKGLTYFDLRDRLVDALEAGGPGTLVHPYLGRLQVVTGLYTMSETWEKGGRADFSISFTEAGALLEPDSTANTVAGVGAACTVAQNALNAGFAAKFSVADEAKWISDAAVAKLGQITKAMNSVSQFLTVPSAITNLVTASTSFSSGLTGLIGAPSALAASILGIIALVPTLVDQPLDALQLYKHGLFNFGATDTPDTGTSSSALQDEANRQAVNTYVLGSSLVGYAQTLSTVPAQSSVSFPSAAVPQSVTGIQGYDTSEAANAALADFLAALEPLLPSLDDASYAAMKDLRAAVMLDIQSRAAALPSLVTVELPSSLPALVLAQMSYGDATRADEIVARNDVSNPNFVPAGEELELLNV